MVSFKNQLTDYLVLQLNVSVQLQHQSKVSFFSFFCLCYSYKNLKFFNMVNGSNSVCYWNCSETEDKYLWNCEEKDKFRGSHSSSWWSRKSVSAIFYYGRRREAFESFSVLSFYNIWSYSRFLIHLHVQGCILQWENSESFHSEWSHVEDPL